LLAPASLTFAQTPEAEPVAETLIVVDEETGTIVFVVEGEEKARLDADGLHINGSIDYTGTIADIGPSYHPAEESKSAAGNE